MIKINAFFGDWKEVDKEQAKRFIKHFMAGIVTTRDKEGNYKFLNGKLEELLL